MSEYDDVCNEVVGDLAVVIYHREQEIEKLKKDKDRLINMLSKWPTYVEKLFKTAIYYKTISLLKEMEDDKDESL